LSVLRFPYAARPLNIAHRGASQVAPENTLAALRAAREMGADGVELDVSLSADGEVVVIHDDTVDRTTDGQGLVRHLWLDSLKSLDAGSWFGPRFAGERIPTLREVLEWAQDGTLLNIELKGISPRPDGLEHKVIRLAREHRLQGRVMLSSFNPFALRRAKTFDPDIETGLLYSPDLPLFLRRAWLRPFCRPDALHAHHTLVSEAYMGWARERGYRVNVWTVDDAQDMAGLVSQGVDMIITNRPDVLASVVERGQDSDPRKVGRNG
jgi:glycerophosphoryl diester phosphodiesterase